MDILSNLVKLYLLLLPLPLFMVLKYTLLQVKDLLEILMEIPVYLFQLLPLPLVDLTVLLLIHLQHVLLLPVDLTIPRLILLLQLPLQLLLPLPRL